jgi:hypothetical protein
MKPNRFTDEQIIVALKQMERADSGGGEKELGVPKHTIHAWNKKYGRLRYC